jgi:hypothetical protein
MNSNSGAKMKLKARKLHLTGIIGLFAHSQTFEGVLKVDKRKQFVPFFY